MRKIILAATALASFAGPAFAADLPSAKEAPVFVPPPPPAFTWTGFYIGADVGAGWGSKTISPAASPFNPALSFDANLNSGVVGGGFVGYNYQINQFVIGVQGDIQGASLSGTAHALAIDTFVAPKQDWLAAINGRLGFASAS